MEPIHRARRAWRAFRQSLLFVPTFMTLGAIALFVATSVADSTATPRIEAFVLTTGSSALGFLVFAGSPDSAARLLASIVSTWATIVGVVYSVTLVTIQLSATKYSAQVIPVFEHDRLNQIVLGAFTGTFTYSLLVLKTIRSSEGASFVPLLGVNITVLLALVSLGLLIAFIGNLTAYIRPTRFVEDYGKRGVEGLPALMEPRGFEGYRLVGQPNGAPGRFLVESETRGYLTRYDWPRLREALAASGPVERCDLLVARGLAVAPGEPVLRIASPSGLSDEAKEALREAFVVDDAPDERDPARVLGTLADIGVTALSGGATDVGVAKVSVRTMLHVLRESVEAEETRRAAFELDIGERKALVVLQREPLLHVGLREMQRVVDKSIREGYWDVLDELFVGVTPFLRSVARAEPEAWSTTLDWLRALLPEAMEIAREPERRRIVRHALDAATLIRGEGGGPRALDLEHALTEAAREVGAERLVEEALDAE